MSNLCPPCARNDCLDVGCQLWFLRGDEQVRCEHLCADELLCPWEPTTKDRKATSRICRRLRRMYSKGSER